MWNSNEPTNCYKKITILQLVVQFLEAAAFTWYVSLPEIFTFSWQAMEDEFPKSSMAAKWG